MTAMRRIKARNEEAGAALVVALIFLMLMSLIGTAAMRGATMQEQMAGHTRDWSLAFQAAEAALREAEDWLLTTAALPDFNDQDGLYQINASTRPVWHGSVVSDGSGYLEYGADIPGTDQRPRYYIEELTTARPAGTETETGTALEDIPFFRVTAVGYGGAVNDAGDPVASVVLSSVFRSR